MAWFPVWFQVLLLPGLRLVRSRGKQIQLVTRATSYFLPPVGHLLLSFGLYLLPISLIFMPSRLAGGGVMFSNCPYVRSFISYIDLNYWVLNMWTQCFGNKWTEFHADRHGGQRPVSHKTEDRFGGLVKASVSTPLDRVGSFVCDRPLPGLLWSAACFSCFRFSFHGLMQNISVDWVSVFWRTLLGQLPWNL